MGFTSTSHNPPSALCFLCGELLANSAMKPAHLQRHLQTKHPHQVGNSLEFFRRKFHEFTSCQEKKATSASAKAIEASYAVSLLLAKAKKPFSLAEELIIPDVAVLAETLGDKTAADKIKSVPLSNDTFSRRIDKMRNDIVEQLVDKLRTGESFSLQLDESFDVSGQVQLVALRYMWIPAAFANTYFFAKHWRGEQLERIFSTLLIRFSQNMKSAENPVPVCALMQQHQ